MVNLMVNASAHDVASLAMASISKRGEGTWRVRSFVERRNGKAIYLTRTVRAEHNRKGRQQAELAGHALDIDAAESRRAKTSRVETFGQLVDAWLEHGAATWAPLTLAGNRQRSRDWLVPTLGSIDVAKIRAAHLDELYVDLGREISPATIGRVHAVASGVFAAGVRWGIIAVNPAMTATPPAPKDSSTISVPTDGQMTAALALDGPQRYTSALAAGILLGARRGELVALRWSDFRDDLLTIERAASRSVGHTNLGATKTGRHRTISVGPKAAAVFDDWRIEQAERWGEQVDLVWPSINDPRKLANPGLISRWWANNRDPIGCQGLRLHDWRHWNATHLLSLGHSSHAVAYRLGHSVAVLENTYRHWIPGADRELALDL